MRVSRQAIRLLHEPSYPQAEQREPSRISLFPLLRRLWHYVQIAELSGPWCRLLSCSSWSGTRSMATCPSVRARLTCIVWRERFSTHVSFCRATPERQIQPYKQNSWRKLSKRSWTIPWLAFTMIASHSSLLTS